MSIRNMDFNANAIPASLAMAIIVLMLTSVKLMIHALSCRFVEILLVDIFVSLKLDLLVSLIFRQIKISIHSKHNSF